MLIKSALRDWLSVSYGMISILLTGSLRSPPFGGCATTFPPQAGALQPVLNLESLMKKSLTELCSATACGGSPAKRARGMLFSRPQGGCMVLYKLAPSINLEAPYNNPRAKGASNFSPLRTFGPSGRHPSSPKGACPYQPSRPSGRSLSTVSPQVSMSSPPAIMTMAARWNQMKRTTRPMREP